MISNELRLSREGERRILSAEIFSVKGSWPTFGHVLLIVPLVVTGAWVAHRGEKAREDPGTVLAALRASRGPALPLAGSAAAASMSQPARYNRDTLYEYIDGAAETYLSHGFAEAVVANYSYTYSGRAPFEIAAEVYRFADSSGARAQLDAERSETSKPLPGLPTAFSDDSVLVMIIGPDLLKLTVLSPDPSAPTALTALATAWRHEMQS